MSLGYRVQILTDDDYLVTAALHEKDFLKQLQRNFGDISVDIVHTAIEYTDDLDDTWYILEGEMAVLCGDDVSIVGPGHWVSMPRGVPHTFRVVGDREARILLVHDNASFRDVIRDLGVPAEARVVPPQPVFPPTDELARIAATHDLRPIGPPMSDDDTNSTLAGAH